MLLTKKEIFERLKQDGVDLGERPFRVFLYYQETGLIPKPEGKRKNAYLFPERTVDAVKLINRLQTEGESITQIKKMYKDAIDNLGEREAEEKKETVKMIYEAFKNEINDLDTLAKYVFETDGKCLLPEYTAGKIGEELLEKYGEFVKNLAIKKLKNTLKILTDFDIKANLVMKKTA